MVQSSQAVAGYQVAVPTASRRKCKGGGLPCARRGQSTAMASPFAGTMLEANKASINTKHRSAFANFISGVKVPRLKVESLPIGLSAPTLY